MVLFFLSYQTRDADSYAFAQNIKNTFVFTSPSFESVSEIIFTRMTKLSFLHEHKLIIIMVSTHYIFQAISPDKFWAYTTEALLPNLYTDKWYNGKDINWREALQIDDRQTIRVGVARFRQLRIKEGEYSFCLALSHPCLFRL